MARHEKKQSDRLSWSVEHTDRTNLLEAAGDVVRIMSLARRMDLLGCGVGSDPELTDAERAAYESALRYVAREFDKGPTPTRTHLTESNAELEVNADNKDTARESTAGGAAGAVGGDDS